MNCSDTATRGGRYPEYTSSSDGWCATTEDYYNENYLPNHSQLAVIPGEQDQGSQYGSYYEYHHLPAHHQNVNPTSTGTSSPQHTHQHHPAPLTHQVSSFPQKRSPTEDVSSAYNNNYESKSPSGATSPWNNYHSFYQKNPSSPTSNSLGSSPPPAPTTGGGSALTGCNSNNQVNNGSILLSQKPGKPSFKRRTTANKKERRRTQSINNAFADLRDCIPNVPADTKLSKIKTLRLATSYIAYLSEVLSGDDPLRTPQAFTAEISKKMGRGDEKRRKELLMQELAGAGMKRNEDSRKSKGRTGWPQHVWALELQQ